MLHAGLAAATAALVFAASTSPADAKARVKKASSTSTTVAQTLQPTDVLRHAVIAEDRSNPERRVITVSLNRRATAVELTRIAEGLFKPQPGGRETALVNFEIEPSRAKDTPWAVARIGGAETKVQFLGLSIDEITQLRAEAANDTRALIGAWLTEAPLSPGRISLYRDGTTPFLEWRLRGGTKTTVEMLEISVEGMTVFSEKSGTGEWFILLANGDLEVRDSANNPVAVATRVGAFGPTSTAVAAARLSAAAAPKPALRTAIVTPTSGSILEPPAPPDAKPLPRPQVVRWRVVPPEWQVRIYK